jgi:hypothetical protein
MGERENLIQGVKSFVKKLPLKVEKAIVFGSRVRGGHDKYSDVDLLIVSPDFKGIKFGKRALGFYKYWNLNYPVDFLCLLPKEFNEKKKKITIVREALKEGIEI